jgi:hypothetical protein
MSLTQKEQELGKRIGFDLDILELVKTETGKTVQQTFRITEDGEKEAADGISVPTTPDDVEVFINQHQSALLARSYRAFWSNSRDRRGLHQDEMVVFKTTDHYDIVRLRQTDGANYDIFNEDILSRLEAWSKICKFDIVGAAGDWVCLVFKALPKDICAFAKDVYKFCPDSVDQGVGLKSEVDDPEMFEAARKLCPTRSTRKKQSKQTTSETAFYQAMFDLNMEPLLKNLSPEQKAEFKKTFEPRIEAIAELAPKPSMPSWQLTEPDMGFKLLAYEIQRKRELFLWWD